MDKEGDHLMLREELRELIGIRILVVLVPALRALNAVGRDDLKRQLERFLGPLSVDLDGVLFKYDIRRKNE